MPFEGPEKKLEIILFSPIRHMRLGGSAKWERVVNASGAEIISRMSTPHVDAYLLSESSLFVWSDRILLITCGQTTLIESVPEIVRVVGLSNIALVFYERKNLLFPGDQQADFEADVERMQKHFPGKSYRLGPANCDHVHLFFSSHAKVTSEGDVTLQLLMSDLPPARSAIFAPAGGTAHAITSTSGLTQLYPDMQLDSHVFSPCGFSLNGISGSRYFTVHVTPQREASYTSFETNVLDSDYLRVVQTVLSIFQPGRFSFVLTSSMDPACLPLHASAGASIDGYAIVEKSFNEFECGYVVSFGNYTKDDCRPFREAQGNNRRAGAISFGSFSLGEQKK
jgi:S-adenosylmethionine decarboxylase